LLEAIGDQQFGEMVLAAKNRKVAK
jgi:hypothetical protein